MVSGATGQWIEASTGTWASADDTDEDYPFTNIIDGLTHTQSRPGTIGADMGMVFNFGSDGIEFDFMVYRNHTLDSNACTALVVQIADDSAFSTNLISLTSINVSTLLSSDRRFSVMSLYHTGATALRYSGVQWVRIQFTFSGAVIPRIGDIQFCRRRQWKWNPNVNDGYDPDETTGDVVRYVSGSGVKRDTVFHAGARVLNFTWTPNATAQHTDLNDFSEDTGFMARPFVYIDQPTTAPNNAQLFSPDNPGKFAMPYVNWQARKFNISGTEQGPHFLKSSVL